MHNVIYAYSLQTLYYYYNRGSDGRISQRYTGQNITISLLDRPDGNSRLTIADIGTFTIWCQRFGVFFSLLELPDDLDVNAVSKPARKNCIFSVLLYK